MNRWRRASSSGLVVVLTVGVGLVVTASPALAEDNKLWVGKIDQPRGTFGANAAVRIGPIEDTPPGVTVPVPLTLVEPEYGSGDTAGNVVTEPGVLTLAGDQMNGKIIVTPVDDRTVEGSEPFRVQIR
jgi:hypothetical protein